MVCHHRVRAFRLFSKSHSLTHARNSLIADKDARLGTLDEVKAHPFFAGVQWATLRDGAAPFVPALDSEVECVHFYY